MRRGGRPDDSHIPVKDMQSMQLEQLNNTLYGDDADKCTTPHCA